MPRPPRPGPADGDARTPDAGARAPAGAAAPPTTGERRHGHGRRATDRPPAAPPGDLPIDDKPAQPLAPAARGRWRRGRLLAPGGAARAGGSGSGGSGGAHPRSSWAARKRLWRGEAVTMPMPIVSNLKGTPYYVDDIRDIDTGEQAREALEIAARIGDLMIRCGAATRDVEAGIIAVASALGLTSFEVDITNQAIFIQSHQRGRRPMIEMRVVRSSTRDLARLAHVHRLVHDIAAGTVTAEQAEARLQEIRRRNRFWPRWSITVAYAFMAAAVTLGLGGSLVAVVLAGLSVAVVDRLGRLAGRIGLATYYQSAIGGATATALAWTTYAVGLRVPLLAMSSADIAYAVAGGIVVLLPGRATVTALEDAISGFPVTAAGRLLGVLMTASGIIVGVAFALSLSLRLDDLLGVEVRREQLVLASRPPMLLLVVLAAGLSAAASSISQRTMLRFVAPTAAIAASGSLVIALLEHVLHLGKLSAITLACVLIGFLARRLGNHLRIPAAVLVTPAVSPLMPGLSIFQGMYQLVLGSVEKVGSGLTSSGTTTLFGAAATALAIATGAILGESLAAPLDGERRRRRHSRRR